MASGKSASTSEYFIYLLFCWLLFCFKHDVEIRFSAAGGESHRSSGVEYTTQVGPAEDVSQWDGDHLPTESPV